MDKVQILIVEDEAIVSMDLHYKLEAMGYGVPAFPCLASRVTFSLETVPPPGPL